MTYDQTKTYYQPAQATAYTAAETHYQAGTVHVAPFSKIVLFLPEVKLLFWENLFR